MDHGLLALLQQPDLRVLLIEYVEEDSRSLLTIASLTEHSWYIFRPLTLSLQADYETFQSHITELLAEFIANLGTGLPANFRLEDYDHAGFYYFLELQ